MKSAIHEAEAYRAIVLKRIDKLQNDAAKKSDPIERAAIAHEIVQLRETMPEETRSQGCSPAIALRSGFSRYSLNTMNECRCCRMKAESLK